MNIMVSVVDFLARVSGVWRRGGGSVCVGDRETFRYIFAVYVLAIMKLLKWAAFEILEVGTRGSCC